MGSGKGRRWGRRHPCYGFPLAHHLIESELRAVVDVAGSPAKHYVNHCLVCIRMRDDPDVVPWMRQSRGEHAARILARLMEADGNLSCRQALREIAAEHVEQGWTMEPELRRWTTRFLREGGGQREDPAKVPLNGPLSLRPVRDRVLVQAVVVLKLAGCGPLKRQDSGADGPCSEGLETVIDAAGHAWNEVADQRPEPHFARLKLNYSGVLKVWNRTHYRLDPALFWTMPSSIPTRNSPF